MKLNQILEDAGDDKNGGPLKGATDKVFGKNSSKNTRKAMDEIDRIRNELREKKRKKEAGE